MAESDPIDHSAKIAVTLRHGSQRVDDTAVEQSEVADVGRKIDGRKTPQHAIKQACRSTLEDSFSRSANPARRHDMIAIPPTSDHLQRNLRRILKIGVHDDHGVAPSMIDAGGYRYLVPVV